MEIKTKTILQIKSENLHPYDEQSCNQQQKLKGISSLVKDLKNTGNSQIFCYFPWLEIQKKTNFLLDYLSKDKITDRTLFFDSLASFDSLLSIFKVNLFIQLKFTKTFYRNIQKEFEFLCLQFEQTNEEKHNKILQFQLYSILFLLVMLIYFSGKKEVCENKNLPLNIINKSFINSFISLDINITQKNERIVGLIVSYLIKNINVKIYGQKMLKFILHHFERITTPRTLYHFVYCLREIHLEREIDIKTIRKYGLIEKLINFWILAFYNLESIYLVDYINVILKKYPSLVFMLKNQLLLEKLSELYKINEFTLVHQGLILQVKAKILPNIQKQYKAELFEKAFKSCESLDYSLKFLSCFTGYQKFEQVMQYIFPFLESLNYICRHKQITSILFSVQTLKHLVQLCQKNRSNSVLFTIKDMSEPRLAQLRQFQICLRDLSLIQEAFSQLISIQQQSLY